MKKARYRPLHLVVRTLKDVLVDVEAMSLELDEGGRRAIVRPGSAPVLAAFGPMRLTVRTLWGASFGIDVSWGALTVAGYQARVLAHDAELEQLPLAG